MPKQLRVPSRKRLRRGLWSPEEDMKLRNHIATFGHGCWSHVPKLAGLERCGKSCRLRWINYLRPDLKRVALSQEEKDLILNLHSVLGNRWSQIAARLPGRTDNEVKNFWSSFVKKQQPLRHHGAIVEGNPVIVSTGTTVLFSETGHILSSMGVQHNDDMAAPLLDPVLVQIEAESYMYIQTISMDDVSESVTVTPVRGCSDVTLATSGHMYNGTTEISAGYLDTHGSSGTGHSLVSISSMMASMAGLGAGGSSGPAATDTQHLPWLEDLPGLTGAFTASAASELADGHYGAAAALDELKWSNDQCMLDAGYQQMQY
ncbi:myb-related protein 340-like [Brachypodium distachyon]|uniref:Uncharacterized protein n=1 Tax=Brachypodium distachyon TaxID=15368 RepID=A0A0Q3EDV5_BRADI|nr:myb-related protein 340-like [Brachypodium distachyon]KQJ84636.1 hypothetical protein BRADI_5g21970v3 [Brachypodium distachyon]|eukprot:XP_024311890.1 myb-related protein 340-like [Brachypodium distachyon]